MWLLGYFVIELFRMSVAKGGPKKLRRCEERLIRFRHGGQVCVYSESLPKEGNKTGFGARRSVFGNINWDA